MSTTGARTRGDALSSLQEDFEKALQSITTLEARASEAEAKTATLEGELVAARTGLGSIPSIQADLASARLDLAQAQNQIAAMARPGVGAGFPPPTPRERTPKLKAPDDFNPTSKSDEVDAWLDCVTRYMANFPNLTSEQKAAYGVSLLRGDANIWWRTLEAANPNPPWANFVELMEE